MEGPDPRRENTLGAVAAALSHTLSRLRREGYTLAICSNAIRDTMLLMLETGEKAC